MLKVNNSLANLGEMFPEKRISCAVPGCENLCLGSEESAKADDSGANEELPRPVCDECAEVYARLQDRRVVCSRPGCEETWEWSRLEQLKDHRRGRRAPEEEPPLPVIGLCAKCREEAKALGHQDVECEIEGCTRTWRWQAQERLCSESDTPEPRMCANCRRKARRLRERRVPCKLDGCRREWRWTVREQLESMVASDSEKPGPRPKRLCEDCRRRLAGFQDRQIPCRIKGCQRTWTLTAEAQLQYEIMHGSEVDPADEITNMCDSCQQFLRQAHPRAIKCRLPGCERSWVYAPRWQVVDFAQGRTHPPKRLCDKCRRQLSQIEPRHCQCAIPGCEQTWIWSPEEQLRLSCRTRKPVENLQPPERKCVDCERFLHEQKSIQLFCNDCGGQINWSPYEQLQNKLGNFAKPVRCSTCATGAAGQKQTRPEDFIQHSSRESFFIPGRGPWQQHSAIQHRPPGVTKDALSQLEKADARIVALGDDLTAAVHPDWTETLEHNLNQQLHDMAVKTAVINAGIRNTGSRQAHLRLGRDVSPFKPHLVIVSLVFGDAVSEFSSASDRMTENDEIEAEQERAVMQSQEELLRSLKELPCKLLYWLPNPIFPHQKISPTDGEQGRLWASRLESRYRRLRAHASRLCQNENVPVLDAGALFEVNGRRSAWKWMKDGFFPNHAGSRNLAAWMAEKIIHESILEDLCTETAADLSNSGGGSAN